MPLTPLPPPRPVPSPGQPRLNVVGAGRVGRTLAHLWRAHGAFQVHEVLARSDRSAQDAVGFIGAGRPATTLADMAPADLWMLAVPDTAIASVAADLAALARQRGWPPALAFHCSGALAASELAPLAALGWPVASAHCLLSFAAPEAALAQFAGTPCALEGDAAALQRLAPAFAAIGGECFTLAREHKLLYHAAAVFATNFVPVLQVIARELWQHSGMPPALLPRVQAALLANAVHNIQSLGPEAALTGPAARGDRALVQAQGLAVAQWDAAAGQAYHALSQWATRIAQPGSPRPALPFPSPTHPDSHE